MTFCSVGTPVLMDTELARTFLAVVAAGNFSHAASQLFVTQSTVSARIATLEEQLGCRLFVRNKAGTLLTPSGHRFQSYATTLVRTVERARQEIGVVRGFQTAIRIGGRFGLWEGLLLECLPRIRAVIDGAAVRAEIGFEDDLIQSLIEARTDIALMYAPQRRPGLEVEKLFEETLVCVSSRRETTAALAEDYVYVDWGPEFANQHNAAFPDFNGAAMSVNIGWLGLQHVLADGGEGYFPLRMVRAALARDQLFLNRCRPTFRLPAFIVFPEDLSPDPGRRAVQIIRDTCAELVAADSS